MALAPSVDTVGGSAARSGVPGDVGARAGESVRQKHFRVLDEVKESGVFVDLLLDYLGALIQHHLDQAVAHELDAQQADVAIHVL